MDAPRGTRWERSMILCRLLKLLDAASYGFMGDDQMFLSAWKLFLEHLIRFSDIDQMAQASMDRFQSRERNARHMAASLV